MNDAAAMALVPLIVIASAALGSLILWLVRSVDEPDEEDDSPAGDWPHNPREMRRFHRWLEDDRK